jgi:hypothetical protein
MTLTKAQAEAVEAIARQNNSDPFARARAESRIHYGLFETFHADDGTELVKVWM